MRNEKNVNLLSGLCPQMNFSVKLMPNGETLLYIIKVQGSIVEEKQL